MENKSENIIKKTPVNVWLSSEKAPGNGSWYHSPSDITYKLEKQPNLYAEAEDNSSVTTIHINPNKKYQSMLGIGISIEESTVYCLDRKSVV